MARRVVFINSYNNSRSTMNKIVFAGSGRFSFLTLKEILEKGIKPSLILVTKDNRTEREKRKKPLEIKGLATEYDIPIEETETKEDLEEKIEKESPSIVLTVAFGIIISPKILNLSKFVNLHPSLLPKYRGPSPIQTAILNKEKESGVTLFMMNEKIDEGPIYASSKVPFHSQITYCEAEEMLAKEGGKLIAENISNILEEKITPEKQNEKEATYTNLLKKEDGRINWNEPAELIERKVRAFNPWPGTYGKMGEKYFKVLEAEVQEQTGNGPFGAPGKVYLGTNHTIAVQTGKDFLLIKSLQIEGKKSTSSKDFLQGNMSSMGIVLS